MIDMHIRQMLEKQEHVLLHERAQFSDHSLGRSRQEPSCPIRPIFQHDRDRILHSKSFRRLIRKTQVFLAPQGDHYRTRMTHTLDVSQISRTMARALRLNEQLTEAIALGHDLGHTPFGHAGEAVLNQLMPGGFLHVSQSVRTVEVLERDGQGLNLTQEVIDGIAKHSKGRGRILSGAGERLPATLEGQLVRVSDIVAYVNHDLDDALRGGVLNQEDIPKSVLQVLGQTHSERISRMVVDVIESTDLDHGDEICMSTQMEEALRELRDFLYERVYENPMVHTEFSKCRRLLSDLFSTLRDDEKTYQRVIGQNPPEKTAQRVRTICDFIAGMTDRYALRLHNCLFIPQPWPEQIG